MADLLNPARLADQAAGPGGPLFAGIAADWAASVPAALDRIRAAPGEDLPAALHELRSGAVAAGLVALPAALAAIEQRAEAGARIPPSEIDALGPLAERSVQALGEWWRRRGG